MSFTENLQTLTSILSTDFLIESRYDIMSNLSGLNTYATTGTAGLIQIADVTQINEGDGFGAITSDQLSDSGLSLQYPLKYNTTFVNVTALSASPESLASVEYVEAALSGSAFDPTVLNSTYLRRDQSSSPDANGYDLGTSSVKWSNIYAVTFNGTATQATYGDIAEKYTCVEPVEIGDIISIYIGEEDYDVEKCSKDCDYKVVGVVSEFPALLMSKDIDGPAVGLLGKLPIKVVGTCNKGDVLVSSNIKGVARAAKDVSEFPYKVGFALESKTIEEVKLVKSIIK